MHPELEKLIDLALADGQITEKKRNVILKKAEALGEDADEVEMIIDAKLHQLKFKANELKKENVNKCPSCGDIIHALSQVCSSCGYVLNKSTILGENSKSLNNDIHQLENLIIDVKSAPKPSFLERLKIVILTYITAGFYLIYRKFAHKKGDSFETLVARCKKESRSIKMYYGEDKKIRLLLEELNNEIIKVGEDRKKTTLNANIGCFGIVIIFIALSFVSGMWSNEERDKNLNEAKKIDSLISIGAIEKAKQEVLKIIPDYNRNAALDKIFIYEIDQHIQNNEIDFAKNKVNSINSNYKREEYMDRVHTIEFNILIEENKLDDARNKALLINNEFERKKMLDKINSLK